MSKYHSRKVVVDGIVFDSRKEASRYAELKMLEKSGQIQSLQRQKKYELIPSQYAIVAGKKKCIERPVCYYADFCYIENGEEVVEDVKGMKTHEYIIKRKLMLFLHHIRIREI